MRQREQIDGRRRAGGAALAAALAGSLGAPAAASADEVVFDPVAAAKARIEQTCLNVDYGDDFVRRLDLNGDLLEDLVITDIVVCDGYHSMFCGVGGCSGEVYVAIPGGGFARTELPPSVVATSVNGKPAVRSGRGRSAQVYLWLGDRFVPEGEAGRLRASAPSAYGRAAAAQAVEALAVGIDASASAAAEPLDAARADGSESAEQPQRVSLAEETAGALLDAAHAGSTAEVGYWEVRPSLEPGGARALVRGEDGVSAMALTCSPGRPILGVALKPTLVAADRLPIDEGAVIGVEVAVDGAAAERLDLVFAEAAGVWRGAAPARGALTAALATSSVATVREPGALDRLARFSLAGSARAIEDLLAVCGL